MKFHDSIVQSHYNSPLGDMVLAATDAGLAGAWFTNQRHRPEAMDFKNVPHAWPQQNSHPVLRQAAQQLTEYFEGKRHAFDLPFDLSGGTLFQQSVWRALLQIGFGQTSTYGNISQQIGNPKAVRAVGSAVGRNPLGIIVPCHRVVGSDGSLTGYAGGLDRKTALLHLEGVLQTLKQTGPAHRADKVTAPLTANAQLF
jgi:methylated-DNA-[protein]-cysteine S-methyltransferase